MRIKSLVPLFKYLDLGYMNTIKGIDSLIPVFKNLGHRLWDHAKNVLIALLKYSGLILSECCLFFRNDSTLSWWIFIRRPVIQTSWSVEYSQKPHLISAIASSLKYSYSVWPCYQKLCLQQVVSTVNYRYGKQNISKWLIQLSVNFDIRTKF